jgi:hypothetical protein
VARAITSAVVAVHHQRQSDILDRAERGQQIEALEDDPQSATAKQGSPPVAHRGQVFTVDDHRTVRGEIQPADQVQQRTLARTAGAHDGHELSCRHGERHASQRPHVLGPHAKRLGQIGRDKHRLHGDRF